MDCIGEIYWTNCIPPQARSIHRQAVRAIMLEKQKLLMVRSSVYGEYKFPGGGLEKGEDQEQALARELLEECGIDGFQIVKAYGAMVEYSRAREKEYDLFIMTSSYYICRVLSMGGTLDLQSYEKTLGFAPMWVDGKEAVEQNRVLLQRGDVPPWIRRDTFVLEKLLQSYTDLYL